MKSLDGLVPFVELSIPCSHVKEHHLSIKSIYATIELFLKYRKGFSFVVCTVSQESSS